MKEEKLEDRGIFTFPVAKGKGGNQIRNYFTKDHFETMRIGLEKYVKEQGIVIREELLSEATPYYLTNKQLGYVVAYSEKYNKRNELQGGICSFIFNKNYYITTVKNLKQFMGAYYYGR